MLRRFKLGTLFLIVAAIAILIRVAIFFNPRVDIVGVVVRADNGEPVGGVTVITETSTGIGSPGPVTTDIDGVFRVKSVLPGFHKISVANDDWVGHAQPYAAVRWPAKGPTVRVTPGAQVSYSIYHPSSGKSGEVSRGAAEPQRPTMRNLRGSA